MRVRSWVTVVRVAARGDDAEMDARAIAVGLVLVSCNADNRDDSPFSGSATAASTMPATNATGETSESASEGEGEGSAGSGSSSGSSGGGTTSGSSGGSGGTTVADSSSDASMTMPDPSATMTAGTSMGGDVCDEYCNGCACPSDQCTMCCAMADKVDACQGGMCTCF